MTEKKQPNAIEREKVQENVPATDLPNAITDPQLLMRMRKKRHLSGLMCPPVGIIANTKSHQVDQ